ncbi:hypothetical protein [Paenibacillus sp. OV219]|uniref:hypothetical protein n=1 Tax=Paenibacillus sp. OV219 TaxID=1884377 RepID=UPI0008C54774|nr:hypothetical protein [Paenibacillus sp. OV219]SEM92066.1 hypothetical protein SAMN05518847_1011149 [Paenibacillus sp. OV219]
MKNNLVKKLSIIVVVLSLTILGTACGNSNNNAADNTSAKASNSNAAANNAAADNSSSDSAAANTGSSTDEAVSQEDAPVVMSGVFNGINADKTIEIETGVGPLSYQLSAELADKVSKWEQGTKVKFEYKENTITTIDKE